MKKAGLVLVVLAVWSRTVSAAPATRPLEVRFIDEYGSPLAGVDTTVRGSGHSWTYPGNLQGELSVKLPEGVYELTFTCEDYYDLVLKGVVIEAREPPRGTEPLRVKLNRQMGFVQDPVITGQPLYIDPPPLEISFRTASELREGKPVHGTIVLKNLGDEPIPVPLEREYRWTPETLVMSFMVRIEGLNINSNQSFVCVSPDGCRSLQPGESIEIPTRLDSADRPLRRYQTGNVEGTAAVYFVPPSGRGAEPTYTRRIETVFHVRVGE